MRFDKKTNSKKQGGTIAFCLLLWSLWHRDWWTKSPKSDKKTFKNVWQNGRKSWESEVRGVPEALGRGLGTILAPKGAPGTKNPWERPRPFPPQGAGWSPKFIIFRVLEGFFQLIFRVSFGKASWVICSWILVNFLVDFWMIFWIFLLCSGQLKMSFLYSFYQVSGTSSLSKYAKNMIKSDTFQGCFPEGL